MAAIKKKKPERSRELTWDQIGQAIGMKIEKGCSDGECAPWNKKECKSGPGCGSAIYGLGFLGALVYYITTSTGFWMAILGVMKAILWPGFLVYGVLKFLGA
ncbi:MAG: hypothetical protein JW727_06575 [Candidatus Aenigmarchaeota archaeon]|nr:hypothetical protein [Candidatus Aenigmarchaeota archaeon]